MSTDHKIITRIPPSPTGHLHIGTARTALFNYLYAKQHGGELVFRSEDTDKARSSKAYEEEIQTGLQWLGLQWDNTPIIRQSERSSIYRTYLEKMISAGTAYISAEPSKQDPSQTVEVVRLKNPNQDITFTDLVRGDITFNTTELGDFVIARSLDDALYHFTVVVDDQEMDVTHILRGEDHISNTPRQILIQMALGFERPQYAHLPLILAPDRSKMSKRHGAVAIAEYQAEGILPGALINYLALLGWNPGTEQEFFTLSDLCEQFSLEKIQKSGAVFNREKLLWLNKLHIQKLTNEEQVAYVLNAVRTVIPDLAPDTEERFVRLLPTILERHHASREIAEAISAGEYNFVTHTPTVEAERIAWKKDPDISHSQKRLAEVLVLLSENSFSDPDTIKSSVWPYAEAEGKGEVLWPLRMALTGQDQSPDPFTVAYTLGKGEATKRIQAACGKIA